MTRKNREPAMAQAKLTAIAIDLAELCAGVGLLTDEFVNACPSLVGFLLDEDAAGMVRHPPSTLGARIRALVRQACAEVRDQRHRFAIEHCLGLHQDASPDGPQRIHEAAASLQMSTKTIRRWRDTDLIELARVILEPKVVEVDLDPDEWAGRVEIDALIEGLDDEDDRRYLSIARQLLAVLQNLQWGPLQAKFGGIGYFADAEYYLSVHFARCLILQSDLQDTQLGGVRYHLDLIDLPLRNLSRSLRQFSVSCSV